MKYILNSTYIFFTYKVLREENIWVILLLIELKYIYQDTMYVIQYGKVKMSCFSYPNSTVDQKKPQWIVNAIDEAKSKDVAVKSSKPG